jgi:RNA polymerase sigma factor (sigma-70 family)
MAAVLELVSPRISGIALGICCDSELARETVQETCLRIIAGLGELREPAAFIAWVDRIATRASIDSLRWRNALTPSEPQTESLEAGGDAAETEDADLRLSLVDALARLSPAHRATVVLYYWLDQSVDEIAGALGCEAGTVKSRLARARDHLSVLLEEGVRSG